MDYIKDPDAKRKHICERCMNACNNGKQISPIQKKSTDKLFDKQSTFFSRYKISSCADSFKNSLQKNQMIFINIFVKQSHGKKVKDHQADY